MSSPREWRPTARKDRTAAAGRVDCCKLKTNEWVNVGNDASHVLPPVPPADGSFSSPSVTVVKMAESSLSVDDDDDEAAPSSSSSSSFLAVSGRRHGGGDKSRGVGSSCVDAKDHNEVSDEV